MSIKIGFMAVGIVLIVYSFWMHCVRKLTVDYAVTWSLLGSCMILVGVIPAFSEWANSLGTAAEWTLFSIGALFLFAEMRESLIISRITLKSKKLAMQVALLSQENETMRAEFQRLAGVQGEADGEKDLICH